MTVTGGVLTGAATPGSLILNLTAGAGFGAGVYTLFDFSSGGVTTNSFEVGDFALGTTIGGYTQSLDLAGNLLQLTDSLDSRFPLYWTSKRQSATSTSTAAVAAAAVREEWLQLQQ